VQPVYRAEGWPDVAETPVPRWDLIDLRHYVTMPVQFSRGCPFDCEFCDIVVMNGRVSRTKEPAQLVRELEALRLAGWKDMVFIVDDNFIGNRKRAKELLQALIEWRQRTGVVTAMVGLLTALPQTGLYKRLAREGCILAETCGNNTDAALNFLTRLEPEFLLAGIASRCANCMRRATTTRGVRRSW
jgi:hypothetical protein